MRQYDELMIERFGKRYVKYRENYNNSKFVVNLKFPLQIDLDLRDACNLNCPACHTLNRKRINKVINKELLYSIVKECKENNLCAINIGGCSEPLIDKDLVIETIELFKNAGVMDIFLHTNGILLDEITSQKIIDAGVTYLCISIDAATDETYKKVRGSNFNVLINNINNFINIRGKRKFPFLRVSFLPTELNYKEKQQFLDYWQNKADIVEIQNYSYVEGGPKRVENIEVSNDIISDSFNSRLKRISIIAPDLLAGSCGHSDVEFAINNGQNFNKYKSITNYMKKVNSK